MIYWLDSNVKSGYIFGETIAIGMTYVYPYTVFM